MMLYVIGNIVFQSDLLPASFDTFQIHESSKLVNVVIERLKESMVNETYIRKHDQKRGYEIRELMDGSWLYIYPKNEIQLWVSKEYTKYKYYPDFSDEVAIQELLCVAIRCRLLFDGILTLHAAAFESHGVAIAFAAPSGTGKSTRASHWVNSLGAKWISGDRPCIDVRNHMVLSGPWDGEERIFHNTQCPLKYIVEIRRASETRVERLEFKQANSFLVQQIFIPMWDTNLALMALALIRKLARENTILRLYCGPEKEAAKETEQLLKKIEALS